MDNKSSRSKKVLVFSFVISLLLALLLSSATTLAAILVLSVGTILFLSGKEIRCKTWSILLAGLLFNLFIIFGDMFSFESLTLQIGKDATFTNRTIIWEKAFEYIKESPIFGNGHFDIETNIVQLGYVNSHNQFIDSLYYGGVIALFFVILSLVLVSKKIEHINSKRIKSFLCFFLISILTKTSFEQVAGTHLYWFLLLLISQFSIFFQRFSPECDISLNDATSFDNSIILDDSKSFNSFNVSSKDDFF